MPERSYDAVLVDVFTRQPFGGNQLAVFTDAHGLSDDEMQTLTREIGFSESTFVQPPGDHRADARVRIFTPMRELPFAGHPVVGTGFVLGAARRSSGLMLELGIGLLRVTVEAAGPERGAATMDQPIPTFRPVEASPAELAGLVGLEAQDLAPGLPAEFGSAGVEFLYLPLRSLAAVQAAQGQEAAARAFFGDHDHPAIFLFSLETAEAGSAAHGRMFSLTVGPGLKEDAATGSAAGPLGAYLVRHAARPPGRLVVEQGYEMGRFSQLEVTVEAHGGQVQSVRVGGGVVRVASARFEL